MNKKISIITVNYNNSLGLLKTIKSVVNQDYSNIEFIIIDGNSTDGSQQHIKEFDNHIQYWISENDDGIYEAMNKGINQATGDYLLFLNSGDVFIENSEILKFCSDKLENDIVVFDCFLEDKGKIVGKREHRSNISLYYVYKYGLKHQSTFIKRELFSTIGLYNEEYNIASDYEFWIRSFLNPKTTSKSIAIPIVVFELGGISQNSDWSSEHRQIEKDYLTNILSDFELIDQLMPYQKSRILRYMSKVITNFKRLLKW